MMHHLNGVISGDITWAAVVATAIIPSPEPHMSGICTTNGLGFPKAAAAIFQ